MGDFLLSFWPDQPATLLINKFRKQPSPCLQSLSFLLSSECSSSFGTRWRSWASCNYPAATNAAIIGSVCIPCTVVRLCLAVFDLIGSRRRDPEWSGSCWWTCPRFRRRRACDPWWFHQVKRRLVESSTRWLWPNPAMSRLCAWRCRHPVHSSFWMMSNSWQRCSL